MDESTDFAMNQLFRAKWNIPQACQHMGLTNCESEWQRVKAMFCEYCIARQKDYFIER